MPCSPSPGRGSGSLSPGAAQRAVLKHFGSVEHFLVILGEAPDATTD